MSQILYALVVCVSCEVETTKEIIQELPVQTEITKPELNSDSREKRTLRHFDRLPQTPYQNAQPPIQRRITNYHSDAIPYAESTNFIDSFNGVAGGNIGYPQPVQNYQPDFGAASNGGYSFGGPGAGVYHSQSQPQQHQTAAAPQYLEPPEPIIEIIIKDSNETLPTPKALPLKTKKKKDHVQVFYVKYKKDDHKGLVIDDPIPGNLFLSSNTRKIGVFLHLLFFFLFSFNSSCIQSRRERGTK